MLRNLTTALLAVITLSATTQAQIVTVSLTSTENGQTVTPGTTVNWMITASVSTDDNEGLAAIVADLVQDVANPELIDIPQADGVPTLMINFSRPDGVTNPGESDPVTGYTGVQRGDAGEMNLMQIGGGQNTFGEALPPGTGVAENAVVTAGVGQSGAVIVAEGSIDAPSTVGDYTFSLADVMANVVTQVNTPPDFSPVAQATVDTTVDSFTFTVESECPADLTGDDQVNIDDIFTVLGLWGDCDDPCPPYCAGDLTEDCIVNIDDIFAILGEWGPCE